MQGNSVLTEKEAIVVDKISSVAGLDTWLYLEPYRNGYRIYDLEENKYLDIRNGIKLVYESITYSLPRDDKIIFYNLLDRLDITINPYDLYSQEVLSHIILKVNKRRKLYYSFKDAVSKRDVCEIPKQLCQGLTSSYYICSITNGSIKILGTPIIITESKWNKIPSEAKGIYLNEDGKNFGLEGRRIVIGKYIDRSLENKFAMEGIHFLVKG